MFGTKVRFFFLTAKRNPLFFEKRVYFNTIYEIKKIEMWGFLFDYSRFLTK